MNAVTHTKNTVKFFSVSKFLFQILAYDRRNEPAYIPIQAGGLFDDGGTDVKPFVIGHQKYGLHLSVQFPVHEGHLEFVLKVG